MKDSRKTTIAEYINRFYYEHDKVPSVREIEKGTGIPLATVHRCLIAMKEAGELTYNGYRSVRTKEMSRVSPIHAISVLGYVACGPGQEEEEQFLEPIRMPETLVERGDYFALIAKGESMIGAGIFPGDYVFVKRQQTASEGDLVIALFDGKNNLKKLGLDKKHKKYILHSCNPDTEAYPDIVVDELLIQGVVKGAYSYLTPDRSKPITSRKLGDDFSKEAILAALEKKPVRDMLPIEKEIKPVSVPRDEDEIRRLIDLDAKRAEGKGEGYIQWAKMYNLKMKAKTLIYLQKHKLTCLEDLYDAVDAAHEKTKESLANLKAIEAELAEKRELQKQVAAYRAGKKLYDEYKTLPKKKQQEFYENNRQPLMLFEASVRYFKEHDIEKLPSIKALRNEIADLVSKKNDGYNEYRENKKQEKELQIVKDNIMKTLRLQEPDKEQESVER